MHQSTTTSDVRLGRHRIGWDHRRPSESEDAAYGGVKEVAKARGESLLRLSPSHDRLRKSLIEVCCSRRARGHEDLTTTVGSEQSQGQDAGGHQQDRTRLRRHYDVRVGGGISKIRLYLFGLLLAVFLSVARRSKSYCNGENTPRIAVNVVLVQAASIAIGITVTVIERHPQVATSQVDVKVAAGNATGWRAFENILGDIGTPRRVLHSMTNV